jgi:hypothetical protein
MKDDGSPLAALLTQVLADDPDWAAYVRNLSPRTPLRRAVADYVHILSARLAPTPRELKAAERILAAMERSGFDTVDEFFGAAEDRPARQPGTRFRAARSGARSTG